MAVSTFVIMMIFIVSNATKELLVSYFYSSSPQLFSITCKIEGDTKYHLTEDEIKAIVSRYSESIKGAYYCASPVRPCTVFGSDASLFVTGMSCLPDNVEICTGADLFSDNEAYGCGIMLSEKIAEELYVIPESAVGRSIIISSNDGITKEYHITGVYRTDTGAGGDRAIVTLSDYNELFTPVESLRFESVQFHLWDITSSEKMALSIKKTLTDRCLETSDYKVRILDLDLTRNITSVMRVVTFVLLVASVIIILVSSIGIRNVIISIMQSYTHIIGIEKAIGASEGIIVSEYLLQGGVIALAGTFFGCASALLFMTVANNNIDVILDHIMQSFHLDYLSDVSFRFSVTVPEILITVVNSIAIVLICCYDPVRRIASMRAVDSIRQ